MSLDGQTLQQIQVENVMDYAYISHVGGLEQSLQAIQGLHSLQSLPDGTTVAFIDPSLFDSSQIFDSGPIEVHQTLSDGNIDLQQCHQVVLEQPIMDQISVQQAMEPIDVKPPIGKGPFNCSLCGRIFAKWNQLQRHLKTHDEDKPFRCNQCPMSYNIEDNLLLHLATHVGPDRDPICPECGKKFSRVASLKAHIMLHEKEENLMCPECGDEFSVQHQLDKHLQEHRQESEGMRTYQCRQCSQEYTKMALLKEHMKLHYRVKSSLHHRNYKRNVDRSGFTHKCKTCTKTFQKPSQLERHERIHTGERPFKCNICPRTFNQKGALQMHMTKHTGARPHKCEFCPMTFAQKGNLRSHIQRVHDINKEEHGMIYECEECSCKFRRLGSLNAHISRAHADHGDSNQTTVQDIKMPLHSHSLQLTDMNDSSMMQDVLGLDHGSLTGASLVDGQVIHGSLDQGASDILQQALENSGLQNAVDDDHDTDKEMTNSVMVTVSSGAPTSTTNTVNLRESHGFPRLGTMAVHDSATGLLKRHYIRKVNGIRWHQCTYCSKEFKKPSDLVRHIRIHTHEKPYKCTQCFRAFAVKSTLTAHIKTHTGLKEFRCEVCSKMFSTQGSLKVHLRLHTGAKPFPCSHCEKTFRTSAHCKSHIQSHFKDPESAPRQRRPFKRESRNDALLTEIALQEPILITDAGLIQPAPRNSMFPQFSSETGNPERPYKCPHCRRGFKKSSHLKQHVRSHTGEKPYRCGICQRSFVSSGVLKAHSRTHSGVKTHKCLVCDAMFTTGGSLKRHMSTHSDVRPFMCPYCQKTFKTSVNCKKHMKTHRHELAMQHYQTVKEGDGTAGSGEVGDGREEDETEMTEEDGMAEPQGLTDLDVLQEQDIGQTATVNQTDMQVVELTQPDLQSGGVSGDALSLNSRLQSFGQELFGHNFTLVNQHQFVQLTSQSSRQGDEEKPNRDQMEVKDESWKSNHTGQTDFSTSFGQQQTTLQMLDEMSSIQQSQQEDEQEEQPVIEDEGLEIEQDMSKVAGRRGLRCSLCQKIFKRVTHLNAHMKTCTSVKSFQCAECTKSFSTASLLKTHQRTHSANKPVETYTSTFVSRRNALQHGYKNVTHTCSTCNEQFRNTAVLRRHMKDCQTSYPISFTVTKMNDENQAPQKRGPRRKSVVQQQFSEEQVSISEKILMESASEKDRISMPKDVQNQTFRHGRFANMCSHCPKSFKKPSDLQRHLRIHTGEKPFICDICHRSFTVKSTLDSHMKTHKTVEKSFLCHVCNSMFSTKGSLKVHMRLHTGAKPFKCTHCDLKFRTSGHRKSHMISHLRPEGSNKKKSPKVTGQPLIASSQNNTVQQPLFILTRPQQNQSGQVVDQSMANQVISVDQSLLQNATMMPVQLSVTDGMSDGTSMPTQVLQGLDGSFQFHITAPLSQLNQGFQLTSLDHNLLQQAVQIDASVLQQLQQNGFIAINPSGIQPTLTADLSQVGSDITHGVVMSQQGLQEHEVSHGNELMGQTIVVSEALMAQIRNSEALMVQTVQGGTTSVSQQDTKPVQIHSIGKMMGSHSMSDALLSQQSGRLHITDSLIGQSVHSSQDSYLPQGTVHVSDAVVGQDRLMSVPEALLGRQITYSDGVITTAGEHTLIQGIQLQSGSMGDTVHPVIVQSISALQGHQQGNPQALNLGNTTFVTSDGQRLTVQAVNVHPQGSVQDLSLMDEDDQKFSLPEDTRMVNIAQLDQNPSMGHHGNALDDEEEEDDDEDVDNNTLVPKSEAESQQEDTERQHICGYCHRGFKRAAHLKEHINTHVSGPVQKKPKATPHKCHVCDKAFQKPSQVERHMRIHTGERPYLCHICSKAFNQKNALQVHLRKHSGEKPHLCPYCPSSFVQSGNLKTHIKRAHHADMVSSMNIPRAAGEPGQAGQDVGGHPVLDEGQGGLGGEANGAGVVGMEHVGMDLAEDDLFVQ
ncbi:zinc finger protein 236-like isoform X2 [Physella acuta]|uniref:zinc finger protein 236-like isoform X2 n=1 Tax=Physella acuta TaxID=109671 RepID=UPI0027DB8FCE|nr:zinc finger protein 236-like isoform X2 [Physella acuta]